MSHHFKLRRNRVDTSTLLGVDSFHHHLRWLSDPPLLRPEHRPKLRGLDPISFGETVIHVASRAEHVMFMAQAKPPSESSTTMVRVMMPMDANIAGNVFGGSILRMIDEVAGIVAVKHCRTNVVTASVDRMDFRSPVYIGDILRMISSVNYTHKTSMEIGVRVEAENALTGEIRHTGTCYLTYVALDKNRKPTLAPVLRPETSEEQRRWSEGEQRRKLRLQQIGRNLE